MEYKVLYLEDLGVRIEVSCFAPAGKVGEWHVMYSVEPRDEMFAGQIERLLRAEALLMKSNEMAGANPVFKRYFLSDATNQKPCINDNGKCTVSYIQQPPLDGSKVALWVYLQRGTEVQANADALGSTAVSHNGYRQIWTMGMMSHTGTSYQQTQDLLDMYERTLEMYGANIAENCIRTWFFVRDVDTQYKGLVVARRENFEANGLTQDTHYISSTGIGGNPSDPRAMIQFGSYAMTGFEPEQQQYLYALSHLNRTIEYGVTFERGTLFRFGDRDHAYISGTASIDNMGQVVHVGNVIMQTRRMWENVEELLKEGGMGYDDVMQIIVYLRDIADYPTIKRMFAERFPNVPCVFTLAPVCRPTWLIEMECIAVKKTQHDEYRDF